MKQLQIIFLFTIYATLSQAKFMVIPCANINVHGNVIIHCNQVGEDLTNISIEGIENNNIPNIDATCDEVKKYKFELDIFMSSLIGDVFAHAFFYLDEQFVKYVDCSEAKSIVKEFKDSPALQGPSVTSSNKVLEKQIQARINNDAFLKMQQRHRNISQSLILAYK